MTSYGSIDIPSSGYESRYDRLFSSPTFMFLYILIAIAVFSIIVYTGVTNEKAKQKQNPNYKINGGYIVLYVIVGLIAGIFWPVPFTIAFNMF
jgi:hypothetical protein